MAEASLEITKRNVTLTSATDSKEFDGKYLTNKNVSVGGDGFAEGEGATYNVTGKRKIAGSSENTFTYALNEGTKADNYNITKSEGTLTVTNREAKYGIVVTANSGTVTYDGTEKSVSGFSATEFTVNDEKYTVSGLTASAKGTNAGEYAANVTGTPTVTDAEGNDVTAQFAVSTVNGKLTIAKRNVTLTSGTAEKEFDGDPLTNDKVTVGGDGFAEGEGATYNVTGSQTIQGFSTNHFTYTLNEGTEAENYVITKSEGTLTVTNRAAKYEITVAANSGTSKYDGSEKSVSGFKTLEFTVNNHKYTVSGLTAEAKATDAGTYTANVTGTPVVTDASGNNVTAQFAVYGTDGTLTIEKRDVTLTSATDSKEFDGKPLTNHEVTVSGDGFAKGEGAAYTVTGSQKIAGSSTNYFTYTLKEGTKADNYNITKNEGTLTVTNRTAKYEITVEANSGSEKYDGTEKSVSGLKTTEFTVNGETYTVSGLTASASGTNAGEYPVNVTGTPAVTDEEGNDVTEQFAVKTENGTLTIAKREITLTSGSAQKEFDGKPLTNDEVTVSGDGFADGEGAEYTVTGSQKIKGTSANEFSYTLNAGTDAANYEITCVEGQLTVTDRNTKYSIEVEANSKTEKYDGTVKAVSGLKTTEFTVEGEKYTVSGLTAGATGTDAGEYTASVTGTAVVKDADKNDVTSQFAVTAKAGKLTITKRDVTLTSGSAEKEFDGDPLTNDKVTVSGDGFAGTEGVDVTVTGSQKYEGSSANRFDYTFKEGTKADNYNVTTSFGTLKVTTRSSKYEIELEPNGGEVVYNDKKHEVSGFKTTSFKVNGKTYTVSGLEASASGTDAGTYDVAVTGTAVVKDADNVDVTSQFSVSVGEGSLEITKAPAKVVIAGNTGVAEYDGTEHTAEGYKVESVVSDNDLYKEDYIKFNGEAKAVRTEEGTKNMGLKTEQFENQNKNFNVEFLVKDGWMQITPIDEVVVIITGHNDEVLYDGTMHTLKGYDVQISNKLFAESDIKVSENAAKASISEVNAGEYSMGLSKDDFSSDNKNFKNVTFRVSDGTLKINKRNITVTSGSASKYYDGKPLRNDNVYVTGDGLADTDELAVAFGEGITEAGKRDNEFNCAVTKKADVAAFKADGTELELDQELQNNYVITKVFGELEVLERSQVIANAADDNNGGNGNPGLVVTDGYNVTTIGDGQTPLAKNLLDLNCCILHLLIMLAAMLVLLWYTHDMKKRQRKIFELEEQLTEME